MTAACVGILLAAGQSTRFGTNKLLHPLADGTPMAVAAARTLQAAVERSIAVVADTESELARLLAQQGLQVIANPCAEDGMGTSIACGVAASPDASGWVIALADMPFIPASIVQSLVVGLARGADIIAPCYQGRRGHPVGFASRHAAALRQLHADSGAHGVIAANSQTLELIETGDAGVIVDIDIDSPAHLQRKDQYL
jgi:molybdenum cofactor cytidylyltransferase